MKKFEILRYLKRFSMLIFLLTMAGAAMIYLYAQGKQQYTASVVLKYTNDGIKDGYAPDGSDLDVNDFRYTLYRAQVHLNAQQAVDEHFLLFNMYTRDIVSVQVNGKPAKRLFPDKADAQSWTTRDCFSRIRHDEYDNRFDVSGLLCEGDNEIIVVYENLGHAHGYFPMEELTGIRQAGLSLTESALTHPLQWECATDMAGITAGWYLPEYVPEDWTKVFLDT